MTTPESLFAALVLRRRDAAAEVDAKDTEPPGWFASTLDLHQGLQVCEIPTDTLDAELLNSLFGA